MSLGRALRHWLFPDLCLACGERLSPSEGRICLCCLATCPRVDPECRGLVGSWTSRELNRVTALWSYDEERVRRIVHGLKYQGFSRLARELGPVLARQVQGWLQETDVLVPVPLHPRRERARGFNQSELLARAVGDALGLAVWSGLVRVRYTRSQTGLGPRERTENVRGAFQLRDRVPEGRLWLVDDVLTTGATMLACAQVLRRAGAEWVGAIALAAVQGNMGESVRVFAAPLP
jgi:ComF family protein|nr:MAG: amidophosphoribosyltransferase [Bacteroidota bacterium]